MGQLQAGNRAISYQYCASDQCTDTEVHSTRRVIKCILNNTCDEVASTNGKGKLTSKSQQRGFYPSHMGVKSTFTRGTCKKCLSQATENVREIEEKS